MKAEHLQTTAIASPHPGGQQAGGPRVAVCVTHTPTGLTATCDIERSQSHNRKVAVAMIERGLSALGWVDET